MDNIYTGAGIYIVIWWLVIFMVLPFGVQQIDEEDALQGHSAGAPKKPMLIRKLLVTTVISAVLWGLLYLVFESGIVSFREE